MNAVRTIRPALLFPVLRQMKRSSVSLSNELAENEFAHQLCGHVVEISSNSNRQAVRKTGSSSGMVTHIVELHADESL